MTKSRIFLYLCLAFIGGVFGQSLLNLPQPVWLGILILGIMLAAIFWPRQGGSKKIAVVGFCLIILASGAWRFSQATGQENSIKQFNEQGRIVLKGIVSQEPDVRSSNIRYIVEAQNYELNGQQFEASGFLMLVAGKYPQYQYGDQIEITGKLQTPQSIDDFDYQKYLAKDEIYSVIYYPEIKLIGAHQGSWFMEKLLLLKNGFENSLGKILNEPQAAFLAGLLLGEKRGLPRELMADFSRTGTTHIIALSGYNITIIAVALMSLFNFFMLRRAISFWVALLVIVLFVIMTGASASAVRAAIMGILVLIAQQAGRLYSIRNALIFAGAVMVFINPKVLTFDLGFQLSFGATLGLVYLSPILKRWIISDETEATSNKLILTLKQILVTTLSAQIAVLPLLVINFGQLSLIAPLANLAILPFIPLTMFWGFVATLGGVFWLEIGKILGWLAWLFLSYEIKIIQLLAKVPLAALKFSWNWWAGGIYYLVLICLVWYFSKKYRDKMLASFRI
jgi:competence protein ComEC